MKKLVFLLIFVACGGGGETETVSTSVDSKSATETTAAENNNTSSNSESTPIESLVTDEVLKQYPNGFLSYLSQTELDCLNTNVSIEVLLQIENDTASDRPLIGMALEALDSCNIPLPGKDPDSSGSYEDEATVTDVDPRASIVNIKNLNQEGVSPHLEIVDSKTLRMFYSSEEVLALAIDLCDYELNCTRQGVIQRVQDLTLVETVDGVRRGYFVELNPDTKQKEIWTAVFSEDGLTFSEKTSLGFSDGGNLAWGVPDAVLLPDGRVRIYWVDEPKGMAGEKIVSATSETTKGVSFVKDEGYRLENGYVDFEVLRAEEGNWEAVFSFSPEKLPTTPQSLFYGTSKNGLDWEFSGIPISPLDVSYLDPSGVLLDDGSYLIVSAVAPNELGTRKYTLYSMQMTLP